jgi:hypothetical protein
MQPISGDKTLHRKRKSALKKKRKAPSERINEEFHEALFVMNFSRALFVNTYGIAACHRKNSKLLRTTRCIRNKRKILNLSF